MRTIASIEKQLSVLRAKLKETKDPEEHEDLNERIDFLQDELDDLESDEQDALAYEEMTGTTPEDLYIERNGFAIRQSEMIERFRNEY